MLVLMSPLTALAWIEPAMEREKCAAIDPASICGELVERRMTGEEGGEYVVGVDVAVDGGGSLNRAGDGAGEMPGDRAGVDLYCVNGQKNDRGGGGTTLLALMSRFTAAAWIAPATEREKWAATEPAGGAGGVAGGGGATRGWQRRSTHQLAVWYPSRRAASRAALSGCFADVSVIR